MEKLLYSITDAGALIGRGKSTAYAMAASGDLETVLVGSQRMVPADALRALVDRLREAASTESPSRVQQILELVDEHGRIDVALIPTGTTMADLEAAKRALSEGRGVPDEAA